MLWHVEPLSPLHNQPLQPADKGTKARSLEDTLVSVYNDSGFHCVLQMLPPAGTEGNGPPPLH